MDDLETLRGKLESLKHLMERYFMGLDKRMPVKERERVTKEIRRFQPSNDSVARFKHQNLIQRLMTLERYWQRTIKAIEEGRYHRDVFKADFRSQPNVTRSAKTAKQTERDAEADADAAAFLANLVPGRDSKASPKVSMRGEKKRASNQAHQVALRGKKRTAEKDKD